MSLRDLIFPSVVDTSSSDIIADFFVPALEKAVRYDRGVGYFSSSWLRLTARGMVQFASNGGRARWIASPILSESDWAALELGSNARSNPILHEALSRSIDDLQRSLEQDTLSALAWMIADEVIDFRLALPVNRLAGGDFHDKFGRLEDKYGNLVCFIGSHNESFHGTINSESFSIFASWQHESLQPYLQNISARFDSLWNDQDPNVRVYDLPAASRAKIQQLRSLPRPYPEPETSNFRAVREEAAPYRLQAPALPEHVTLRDYQEEAIDAWFDNHCVGLLEMATGTGKTITALAASLRLLEREKRLAIVVAAPYQHLVDQWSDEAASFSYRTIQAYRGQDTWRDKLQERIYSYNQRNSAYIAIVTTHDTFSTEAFQSVLATIEGPVLLIADEVHHLGSKSQRTYLPEHVPFRLALSATPERWYDDEGTDALRRYFGRTVFELSLADAIGLSLTPYYYYPVLVELTDEEMKKYRDLSLAIARLLAKQDISPDDEELATLLRRRANLLNTATNKISVLSELVRQHKQIKHTLFYCAPKQIDDVVRLLGFERRLLVHRFTAQEDIPTRRDLLQRFANGDLDALVAMHCLDEGVDVPSTRTAYILASSGNPRQFIQRRGRVLRKYPGKTEAVIYDLVTIPPPDGLDSESMNAERSILRRELKRFAEFADSSLNARTAYDVIWDIATQFGVLDFD